MAWWRKLSLKTPLSGYQNPKFQQWRVDYCSVSSYCMLLSCPPRNPHRSVRTRQPIARKSWRRIMNETGQLFPLNGMNGSSYSKPESRKSSTGTPSTFATPTGFVRICVYFSTILDDPKRLLLQDSRMDKLFVCNFKVKIGCAFHVCSEPDLLPPSGPRRIRSPNRWTIPDQTGPLRVRAQNKPYSRVLNHFKNWSVTEEKGITELTVKRVIAFIG